MATRKRASEFALARYIWKPSISACYAQANFLDQYEEFTAAAENVFYTLYYYMSRGFFVNTQNIFFEGIW
jgi:hypothetical protein